MSMPRGPGIQSMSGRRVQAMMQAAKTPRMTVEKGLKKKRMRMTARSQAEGASQTGRERGVAPLERGVVSIRGESGRGGAAGMGGKERGGGGGWNFGVGSLGWG